MLLPAGMQCNALHFGEDGHRYKGNSVMSHSFNVLLEHVGLDEWTSHLRRINLIIFWDLDPYVACFVRR